jgi:hypothetical protein
LIRAADFGKQYIISFDIGAGLGLAQAVKDAWRKELVHRYRILHLNGVALVAGRLFLRFAAYPILYHCMTV